MSLTVRRTKHYTEGGVMKSRNVVRGRKLNRRQKNQVKRIVGVAKNTKYYDSNTAAFGVDASGTIIGSFSAVPQGSTEVTRVGDNLKCKSLKVRFSLTCSDTTNQMRVVLFRWAPDNNVDAPTIAKFFQQVATNPWHANINWSGLEEGKIHVIYDKCFSLYSSGDSIQINRTLSFYGKKLGKKRISFNTAAATGTDQIYMALISDSAGAAHPFISVTSRFEFTDA